jgi:ribosomal protein S27E
MPAAPNQIHCPECGAPAPFRGAAISLVCEYCGSTVVRTGVDVKLIGKVSALLDTGSPILLGSRGTYDGRTFEVVGRLQLRYRRGTWNEWFLQFAGDTVGWLADAQGSYSIVTPQDKNAVAEKVPTYSGLAIGQPLRILGGEYVPVDRVAAEYQGAEGVLPFEAEPGVVFYSADLRGYHGEFLTLDYGSSGEHRRPTVYSGRAVELLDKPTSPAGLKASSPGRTAVALHPLRKFEGWRT